MDPNNPNQPQQPLPGGYPPPQQPPPPAYPPQQPPPSGAYPPPQQPSGAYPPPGAYPPQMPPSGAYPPPQYPPSNAYPPPSGAYPPGAYPPPYTGQPYPGQPPYPGQQPQQQIDFQKAIASFSTADWLIVGGAIVAFIASFLPWYSISYTILGATTSASVSGWDYWSGSFSALIALATLAYIGVRATGAVKLPTMSFPERYLYIGAGALITVLSLIYLTRTSGISEPGISAGPSFGLFLGVLAGIAIAVGGYLKPNTPVA